MIKFINKDAVICAKIVEPYKSNGSKTDFKEEHGWKLVVVVGFTSLGDEITLHFEYKSKEECVSIAEKIGLQSI